MKNNHGIYAICCVIIPVTLGLGLIYQSIIGGMAPVAALASLLGFAMLIPCVATLVEIAREAPFCDTSYSRPLGPRQTWNAIA